MFLILCMISDKQHSSYFVCTKENTQIQKKSGQNRILLSDTVLELLMMIILLSLFLYLKDNFSNWAEAHIKNRERCCYSKIVVKANFTAF